MKSLYIIYYLVIFFYIVTFLLQCVYIYKFIKKGIKYFSNFKGVFWAIIASTQIINFYSLFVLTVNDEFDLSDGFFIIGTSFLTTILFITQGIIGFVIMHFIKKKNPELPKTKVNYNALLLTLTTFIVTLIVSISLYNISSYISQNSIKTATLKYLSSKYGNYNYRIINVDNHYSYNGIVSKSLTGYDISVINSSNDSEFKVSTDIERTSFYDTLLKENYNSFLESDECEKRNKVLSLRINEEIKKLENYINQYSQISIKEFNESSYSIKEKVFNSKLLPSDYGKIPSIDELYLLAEKDILNTQIRFTIPENIIDKKVYSMQEAVEVLEIMNQDVRNKYTLSGLTVYNKDTILKTYHSENDLMNNLIKDLPDMGYFLKNKIPKINSAILDYYTNISKYILKYYPDINYYKLTSNSGGYIIIDSHKIYISTNGDDIKTAERIINF